MDIWRRKIKNWNGTRVFMYFNDAVSIHRLCV